MGNGPPRSAPGRECRVNHELTRLTLRQLRYFKAVAEQGGFRHAAERLHMSQPPLTQAMKTLEAVLGVRLFERDGRGIRLSAAAEALLSGVDEVFDTLERVCERVQDVGGYRQPRLLVGVTDDFLFSPLLTRVLAFRHPEMPGTIDMVMGMTHELLRQLTEGAVDLALTIVPHEPPQGITVTPVCTSRLVALVPAGHALARAATIAPEALAAEALILMPSELPSVFVRCCEMLLNEGGHRAGRVHQSTNSAMTQSLVERGFGIGLVSEYSVRDTDRSVRVPILSPHAVLQHVMLTPRAAPAPVRQLMAEVAGH